jgi:D-sedoheptulose 7-phosphate isomerase
MKEKIISKLTERIKHLESLDNDFFYQIREAYSLLENSLKDNKIIIFGNGGSATQSSHFAAELVNRLYKNRPAINAISLTTDIANISSIANDFGYENVFSRQIEAIGKKGDIAVGFTTGGKSENVLKAFRSAKTKGLKTIAVCGSYTELLSLSGVDKIISVKSVNTAIIQEIHLFIIHFLAELLENHIINGK